MNLKRNYIIKPFLAMLILSATPCYSYTLSIADKISINPFFSFSAPFTQLKKVEYSAQYTLTELTESNNGDDGTDIMPPPPIAKSPTTTSNKNKIDLIANKDFNPYGYEAGLLFNEFLAISYGFKTTSQAKSSDLQDSTTSREFFYEIDGEKHSFASHSLHLAFIKKIDDKTSFYINFGVAKENYESSYRIFNNTVATNYKYNLKGPIFNFGAGANILVRPANYINISTKIETGKLKGYINTTLHSNTLENPINYQGDIATNSFASYSIEVNYVISLKSSPNLEKAIGKIL